MDGVYARHEEVEALREKMEALDTEQWILFQKKVEDERTRRFRLFEKRIEEEHRDKIASLRPGHRLVIKKDLGGKLSLGRFVKLKSNKRIVKNCLVVDSDGVIWRVPVHCVGDAEDEKEIESVRHSRAFRKLLGG